MLGASPSGFRVCVSSSMYVCSWNRYLTLNGILLLSGLLNATIEYLLNWTSNGERNHNSGYEVMDMPSLI